MHHAFAGKGKGKAGQGVFLSYASGLQGLLSFPTSLALPGLYTPGLSIIYFSKFNCTAGIKRKAAAKDDGGKAPKKKATQKKK